MKYSCLTKVDELESDNELDYEEEEEIVKPSSSKKSKSKKNPLPKAKLIQFDQVNIPKGDKSTIEKFVSSRTNEDGSEDLLVKYKNMSYYHVEWIPVKAMEEDKNLRVRVRRFLEKPSWENQWSEDEPFNPAYCKVFPFYLGGSYY
jgi:hypothetical protein